MAFAGCCGGDPGEAVREAGRVWCAHVRHSSAVRLPACLRACAWRAAAATDRAGGRADMLSPCLCGGGAGLAAGPCTHPQLPLCLPQPGGRPTAVRRTLASGPTRARPGRLSLTPPPCQLLPLLHNDMLLTLAPTASPVWHPPSSFPLLDLPIPLLTPPAHPVPAAATSCGGPHHDLEPHTADTVLCGRPARRPVRGA